MQKKIIVIGGDKRFIYLQKMLSETFSVLPFTYEKDNETKFLYENIESADIIVFPYPITFDKESINAPLYTEKILLSHIFSHIKPHHTLLTGGKLPLEFRTEKICRIYDYTASEELLWANAQLTAEGLLRLVIEDLPTSLKATSVAITGAGRVGTEAAKLFKSVGCKVTMFARSASTFETNPLPYDAFNRYAGDFDCIINSVPALVLDEAKLRALKPDCLLLEAASAPYGIDFKAAEKLGLKAVIAGSLPGKTSPVTAAEIICKSVMKLCFEGG